MNIIAEYIQARSKGKQYIYNIFDGMHTGICTIESVKYDGALRQFIFYIKDLSIKNQFIIDRCHIYLKELKD